MKDLLVGFFLLTGAAFMLLSAIGILRMPDVLIRLHALTKAGTFGVSGVIVAVILHFQDMQVLGPGLLIIMFFLVTFPVAGHLIGRAAYFTGTPIWEKTKPDELADSRPEKGAGAEARE